jgi:predicted nucleic acid-binding protein/ribosomal protein S18 acetylase RimI-like enzyme
LPKEKLVTFRILTHYNEVQHYFNSIRQAVDAQKTSLGFWPPSEYEQAASQERLWVAVDEEAHYLGHILFGAARPSIKVFQISVQAEFRWHGIAKEVLSALEAYGEKNDYMSILARVAIDLPANGFWDRSGYPIIRQVEGEGRRTLNVRGKQLRVVSLFPDGLLTSVSPPALQFAERPLFAGLNYVLDLNVIFDLKKHRPREKAARQLVKLALAGPYKLFVADEAVAELLRASLDPENDSVLSFVRDIPALPDVPVPEIERTLATLAEILCVGLAFDQLTANQRSDLLHLAQSIHHGIRGFITADGQLLRSSEAIHDRFGLEIISPFELVAEAPPLTSYEASLKGGAFSIREITESDRHRVGDFLSSIGVPPALSTEALQPVIGGTRRIRRAAFVNDTLIGYLSWGSSPTPSREVFFFADESHSVAARVVDTALNEIANSLPIRRTLRVDLRVLSSQLICRECQRRTKTAHLWRVKIAHSMPS